MKVRIAISPGASAADPSSLAAAIDGLEARGFDTIWLSDGWLGANLAPAEAGIAVRRIGEIAAEAEREIDPEHFGLSIPYLREAPGKGLLDALRARRPDGDVTDIAPVGAADLRRVLTTLIDEGLSKFVLRPMTKIDNWDDELSWLAETVLDLQA